jgi:hypothetical protein
MTGPEESYARNILEAQEHQRKSLHAKTAEERLEQVLLASASYLLAADDARWAASNWTARTREAGSDACQVLMEELSKRPAKEG